MNNDLIDFHFFSKRKCLFVVQEKLRKYVKLVFMNLFLGVVFGSFHIDRKDAEGWETVQRGRPIRSRSTAVTTKTPLAIESLRSKDDSDKENTCCIPSESKPKSLFTGDIASKTVESLQKDSSHQCEHPLTERSQVSII